LGFIQRFDKKAVQIPVMMVVILIIAIITLGLIIGFIRYFFGETEALVRQQLEQVKQDLQKDLEEGRELLATNFGRKLEIAQGEPKGLAFGIKNSFRNSQGDSVCYLMGVKCVKAFTPTGFCNEELARNDIYIGGVDLEDVSGNSYVAAENSWVTSIEQGGQIDILNNEVQVGEILFQIPALKDSYTTQLVVWKEKNNNDCANAIEFAPWQTFRYTTTVS
jgi:hypothetical protein